MTPASLDTSAGVPSAILRPKFEHDHLVGDAHHHLHVVLDEQHGEAVALARSCTDRVGQLVHLGVGEAAGRLVEQQQVGARRPCARAISMRFSVP